MRKKLLYLLLGLVSICAAAQPRTGSVGGRVVDAAGEPIVGASVEISGSQRGTTTDNNGQFTIANVAGNSASISVTFVGMTPVRQRVAVGRPVTITLHDAALEVEEVVVTGLFTRPGDSFTGAAKSISGTELKRVGSGNLFQSLRNLDPALNLIDNLEFGSDPNRLPDVQLRGQSSFPLSENDLNARRTYQGSPNMPLFILNGFEVDATRIFDLDMERVGSVTILKDASAKAIYGEKAANGVVVIETKRNSGGELTATYRGSLDLEIPDLASYDLTNALEKLEVERLSGVYDQNTNIASLLQNMNIYNERLNRALAGTDTDWLSKPLRMGVGTKHSLGLDLTDGNLSTLIDLGYNNVAGVMKGSGRNTISASMDMAYRKSGKFLVRNQMNVVSNKSSDSPWGKFEEYANANPYNDPYDRNGFLVESFLQPGTQGNEANPMWNTRLNTVLDKKYLMFSDNLYIEYYPLKGLTLRLRGGVETRRDNGDEFYPGSHTKFAEYSVEDATRKGSYSASVGRKDKLDADFSTMYNKSWGKHTLIGNFNYKLSEEKAHEVTYTAEGFPADEMDDILFARQYASGNDNSKPKGWETIKRGMSFTGLVSYIYDNRYMADVTLRTSASSQYSPKKRWGSFWSAGVGWNVHNEAWAKNISWLDRLKLRGSMGTSGTQDVEAYAHMVTYAYNKERFYDMGKNNPAGFGAMIERLANENLVWQQKMDVNAGFDAMFWNKLSVVFDAYISTTENLVSDFSLHPSTGYKSVKENIGNVENKGLEFNATYRLINRDDFFLNLTGALVVEQNKIKKLSEAMRKYNEQQDALFDQTYDDSGKAEGLRQAPVLRYVEGGSMSTIWAVRSLGIDPATGQELFMGRDGQPTYTWKATDQVACGNYKEKYHGNFGFNGEWKGFGMSVVCRFLGGGQYYNSTLVKRVENVDIYRNVDRRVFTGRWSENNPNAPYKAFRVKDEQTGEWKTVPNTQPSSRFVQDRNELDIASVSAYYDLGRLRAVEKMGFRRMRLAFNMNDVHKFSSIKIERGTTYPFARKMSFSLTAEF